MWGECCDDILELLCQSVHIAKCCGANDYAELQYGDPELVPAYVELETSVTETTAGGTLTTTHRVYVANEVGQNDLLWLPGTDCTQRGQARTPRAVVECFDPQLGRAHHWEVLV